MYFIDLFAGLGGFHIALRRLGHECVFASEIVPELKSLYRQNFGVDVADDITKIPVEDIPAHDILCAGFPCQPFSKAGRQKGMQEDRGLLINSVIEILSYHRPRYFILENVRNLEKHDNGKTWQYIKEHLEDLGYSVDKRIISPHEIGIPQHRERIFIVGSIIGLNHFEWFDPKPVKTNVRSIIDDSTDDISLKIEPEKLEVLNTWQQFLDLLPPGIKPYSPLWSMEFGATYPVEDIDYSEVEAEILWKYKGRFGVPLYGLSKKEILAALPNYIQHQKGLIPKWKQNYIKQNRRFYQENKSRIDTILPKLKSLQIESWQKLEWNCPGSDRNLWNHIIQFRGSGVRVKQTDFFPSLVTVRTQMPIIGWKQRYISKREGARIQSIPDNIHLPKSLPAAFKALGNSVNINIVYEIARSLIRQDIP